MQGPIAVESVRMIAGGNVLKACQAVAYGNSWTNMCQPFWALALLGFTGLKAKDIMGYSTAIMLGAGLLLHRGRVLLPCLNKSQKSRPHARRMGAGFLFLAGDLKGGVVR